MKKDDGSLPYSGAWVRAHDPDRFLLSLTAPPERRPDLWALYAFYGEIDRTRYTVRDPLAGLIRMQWWRDEMEKIYAGIIPENHPVLNPLAAMIARYKPGKVLFDDMIEARCCVFEEPDFPSRDFPAYVAQAHAPLARLATLIDGVPADPRTEQNLAQAFGATDFLQKGLLAKREQVEQVLEGLAFIPKKYDVPRLRGMDAIVSLRLRAMSRAGNDPMSSVFYQPVPFRALRYIARVYL